MDNGKAIELLNQDMQLEHAAIIQYLTQAYAFGEGGLACEIEAISREEMQHFRWLAEKIVALGGMPSMARGEVVFGGPLALDMLQADVAAEEQAIAQYRQHIAALNDPEITILLNRISADESAHHDKFLGFKGEQDPALAVRMESAVAEADQQKAVFMQEDATHEYTVSLQYLAHAFLTPYCEVEHEMEYIAVDEMRHLGWLAEKMEDFGARADMVHDSLELPADTADMLNVDIAVEKKVAARYREQAGQSDPAAAQLFERLAAQEDYHAHTFDGLLDVAAQEVAAQPPAAPALTVGSLLNREQK